MANYYTYYERRIFVNKKCDNNVTIDLTGF